MKQQTERKIRYFYPYCGHRLGFCQSLLGCRTDDKDKCPFYSLRHPITDDIPKMVSGFIKS